MAGCSWSTGVRAPRLFCLIPEKIGRISRHYPKTLADVLRDTYGKEAADQIQKTIRDYTAHQYTEAAAYRADLSYVPGK